VVIGDRRAGFMLPVPGAWECEGSLTGDNGRGKKVVWDTAVLGLVVGTSDDVETTELGAAGC